MARSPQPGTQATRRDRDVVVPPRNAAAPVAKTTTARGEHLVRLDFPMPISEADIVWRLSGDILEIEYVGGQASYYHNFLVPGDSAPDIAFGPFAFEARFRSPAGR